MKPGWFQSYPSVGDNITAAGLNTGGEVIGSKGYSVNMTSRDTTTHVDNDFGNYQEADLRLAKTGTITYVITVTNDGPSTALDVLITDNLTNDLSWTIVSIEKGVIPGVLTDIGMGNFNIDEYNYLSGTVEELADGESVVVTLMATIDSTSESPILENIAEASSPIPDPDLENNSDFANIGPWPPEPSD